MHLIVYFFIFLSIIPISSGYLQSVLYAEPASIIKKSSLIDNFVTYRQAVLTFADQHKDFVGTISDSQLANLLPPNFVKTGSWTNYLSTDQTIIYAQIAGDIVSSNTLKLDAKINKYVGYARNQRWITSLGDNCAAPNYVPNGALLSMINRK